MGISRQLAEFVATLTYDAIPPDVIAMQKKSLIDGISIILGATTLGDGCQQFVDYAVEAAAGGQGDATVLGYGYKLPVEWAAFANASMSHSLDFGDTYAPGPIHSNSSSIPAALAFAEKLGNIDGRKLLVALIAGSEVACRLALGANHDALQDGWYMPPIFSSFAATAAVCKLLDLNADQILSAFSFTLNQVTCSSELVNHSDTVIRSVREAFAAKASVVSARLAQRDLIGFQTPFEGKLGFYHAYFHDDFTAEKVVSELGTVFESAKLSFKVWPSCMGTHGAIDGTRNLMREHGIDPAEIDRIHVTVSTLNEMLFTPEEARKAPETTIIAKFSIPYTASTAAITGNVGLADFSPEAMARPDVRKLAAKFTYEINPDWQKGELLNTAVAIHTARGIFSKLVTHPYGNLANPASQDDLNKKMYACAKVCVNPISEQALSRVVDMVQELEQIHDVRALIEQLHST